MSDAPSPGRPEDGTTTIACPGVGCSRCGADMTVERVIEGDQRCDFWRCVNGHDEFYERYEWKEGGVAILCGKGGGTMKLPDSWVSIHD